VLPVATFPDTAVAVTGGPCYQEGPGSDRARPATVSEPTAPPEGTGAPRPIHPDIDWQAQLLADKVLRRVMSLADAAAELSAWQAEALAGRDDWRAVEPRALIVTHMMNKLLARGY
jgi:hypothetical protein